jgi:hypothetical protein
MPPQTRRLLMLVDAMVRERCEQLEIARSDYRFSRREVREQTGWGHTQLKLHLHRLEELEYLLVHRGGRGQSIVYELLYNGEGQDGSPFLVGLVDPMSLPTTLPRSAPASTEASSTSKTAKYDLNRSGFSGDRSGVNDNRSGLNAEWSGSSRPQVGVKSGGGRGAEIIAIANKDGPISEIGDKSAKSIVPRGEEKAARSYFRQVVVPIAGRTKGKP